MVDAESSLELAGFPKRLRKLCKQIGISQQELSRLCGLGLDQRTK
jgi:hypothetical protein